MQSANKAIVAAAGSGKTTSIVKEAISKSHRKIAIVTYTLNNEEEIRKKFYELHGKIPQNVTLWTWFSFLLSECARPYQNFLYADYRIESIAFVEGRSPKYIKKENTRDYYLKGRHYIYEDKIAEFAWYCDRNSKGLMIDRLAQIYDEIYVDEVQDLAGYDLELVELMLKSPIKITLVGDNRQAIYSTNNAAKNSQFRGPKIVDLFHKWEKKKLCTVSYLAKSYRCNQAICDFADRLYPEMQRTESENHKITGHDGIFLVPKALVNQYVSTYSPMSLRFNKRTDCLGQNAINFGQSKGLTFERVLIFTNNPIQKYLSTGDPQHIMPSREKFYVAITRARYSVGFVYSGTCRLDGISPFELGHNLAVYTKVQPQQYGLWENDSP